MMRRAILDAAAQAVCVDRAREHGPAEDTFGRIASLWSAFLGIQISAVQVAQLMVLFKVARSMGNPTHGDNWVDMAGYAACGAEIAVQDAAMDDLRVGGTA